MAFEILTIRSGGGLLIVIAVACLRPALWREVSLHHLALHAARNGFHFASQYAWALSLTLLPLATVFALEFTMPAWVALLAVLLLGERMSVSRLGSIALGFLGVLIILRPGLATFQPAVLLVLACAFGFAISVIATKKLTDSVSTFAIVFWMNLMQLPIGLSGSDPFFVTRIETAQLLSVAGVAIAGLSAHYCLSNAFRSGDAIIVVPMDFLRIPLIALVGWAFYAEALDFYVFAGAAVIVSGVVWTLTAESRGRAAPSPAAAGGPPRGSQ